MKKLLFVTLALVTLNLKAPPRPCTPLVVTQEFRGLKLCLVSDYDTHLTLTYTAPSVTDDWFQGEKNKGDWTWDLKKNGDVLWSLLFASKSIDVYSYLSGEKNYICSIPCLDDKFSSVAPVFDQPNNSTLIVKFSARTD